MLFNLRHAYTVEDNTHNLLVNSFQVKSSEVCHYTVLNGTLVIPCVTSVPVQA